jgi:hypothetical protein
MILLYYYYFSSEDLRVGEKKMDVLQETTSPCK